MKVRDLFATSDHDPKDHEYPNNKHVPGLDHSGRSRQQPFT